jgi:hypothetical protein
VISASSLPAIILTRFAVHRAPRDHVPGLLQGTANRRPESLILPTHRGDSVENSVHRLKVKLRSVKPPVWRRLVVRSEMPLGELSVALEAAMGWYGGHLHVFDVGDTHYGTPDSEWGRDDLDEGAFRVRDV